MTTFEQRAKSTATQSPPRPLGLPTRKADSLDLLVRLGVSHAFAFIRKTSLEGGRQFLATKYSRYNDEILKALVEYAARGVAHPATTYDPTWAADLVGMIHADVIQPMLARSAFAQLAGLGLHLQFGRAGQIVVPQFNPSIAGGFIREGEPIPVVDGGTAGVTLRPKKLAVITTFSRELSEGSVPAMEGLLRARIQEATGVALDAVLLDDQPAADYRPAGLLSQAEVVPTSDGLQGDLQALSASLFQNAGNFIRNFVMIMNPAQAFASRLQQTRDICPIITSPAMPPGTVVMLDAADFVAAGGDMPRFEIANQAALHMESVAPDHIVNGGTATPTRSLWQTDSFGLRLILQADWGLRRPEAVAVLHDVFWQLGGGGGAGVRPTPPTYVQPIFALAGTAPLGVEVGSSFVPTLTANWTQNDAGDATAYRLTRNGSQIFSSALAAGDQSMPHTDAPVANITANITYAGFIDHGQGDIKNDSEGNPHPAGRIPARTNWPSNTVVYLAQRRAFFGVLTAWPFVPNTAAFIRGLPDTLLNPVNGSVLEVDISAGDHGAVFAYPATLRAPTSIMNRFGQNITGPMVASAITVNVGGVNDVSPIPYRVIFANTEFPFNAPGDTYTLTI